MTVQDPAEIAREILKDPSYQSQLPGQGNAAGGAGTAPSQKTKQNEETAARESFWDSIHLPQQFWLGAAYLLFAALALFAVVRLAMWLHGRTGRGPKETGSTHKKPLPVSTVDPAMPAIDPALAGRYAASGRYAEALHALLIEVLADCVPSAAPGRTSRELAREAKLDESARHALRELVDHVERSLFGNQVPAEPAWQEGLAAANRARAKARRG